MGSPVSPIVANLYMEYFEQKAVKYCPQPFYITHKVKIMSLYSKF